MVTAPCLENSIYFPPVPSWHLPCLDEKGRLIILSHNPKLFVNRLITCVLVVIRSAHAAQSVRAVPTHLLHLPAMSPYNSKRECLPHFFRRLCGKERKGTQADEETGSDGTAMLGQGREDNGTRVW